MSRDDSLNSLCEFISWVRKRLAENETKETKRSEEVCLSSFRYFGWFQWRRFVFKRFVKFARFKWSFSLIIFFPTWRWKTKLAGATKHGKRSWTSSNACLVFGVLPTEDNYSLGASRHKTLQTRHIATRKKLHLLSDCNIRRPTCERDYQ